MLLGVVFVGASIVLIKYPRLTVNALVMLLVITFFIGIAAWRLSAYVWDGTTDLSSTKIVNQLLTYDVPNQGLRVWQTSKPTESVILDFDAKIEKGQVVQDWDWLRNHPDYQLEPYIENGQLFTRVITPSNGNPRLRRSFELGYPAGGRTFRASLQMRASQEVNPEGCRGIMLIAGYAEIDNRGKKCLSVSLESRWKTFDLVWTVPEEVNSNTVYLDLTNFAGLSFDVRNVKLFIKNGQAWQQLAPLIPASPYISISTLDANGRIKRLAASGFVPTNEIQRFIIPIKLNQSASYIIVRFHLGKETNNSIKFLRIQNFEIKSAVTQERLTVSPPQPLSQFRQRYFFPHANLAGHSVAVLGLIAFLSLASRNYLLPALGVIFLSLPVVWMTGSRTAWLSLILGFTWLLYLSFVQKGRLRQSLVLLGIVMILGISILASFEAEDLGRVSSIDTKTQILRRTIWATAWDTFKAYRLTGVNASQFAKYIEATGVPSGEIVAHAHNLWLQFAVSYGVTGLLAIIWLTGGFVYLAWRWGRWHGLALIIPVLIMNIFDYTFFYAGVLFPLILGMNSLRNQGLAKENTEQPIEPAQPLNVP